MKNVINTAQAAKILKCGTRSVPTVVARYRLDTGQPVAAEKVGGAWAWNEEHIRKVAVWRETDPRKDGATFTAGAFNHIPTSRQRVQRVRLGRVMRGIEERRGLDVLR